MQLAALFLCASALSLAADWKPADGPLTTPWTAKVTAGNALPEYPRPQMVRAKWTNLNGLWDFAIRAKADDAAREVGRQDPGALRRRIRALRRQAPASRPSSPSGIAARSPPPPPRARACCSTSAPSTGAPTSPSTANPWAATKAATTPSRFDITDALKPGSTQELTVAVWDPTDTALNPRGKQVLNPNGIWYTAVTGIWQTVWLEIGACRPHRRTRHDARYRRAPVAPHRIHGGRRRISPPSRACAARKWAASPARPTAKSNSPSARPTSGRPIRPRSTISMSA